MLKDFGDLVSLINVIMKTKLFTIIVSLVIFTVILCQLIKFQKFKNYFFYLVLFQMTNCQFIYNFFYMDGMLGTLFPVKLQET